MGKNRFELKHARSVTGNPSGLAYLGRNPDLSKGISMFTERGQRRYTEYQEQGRELRPHRGEHTIQTTRAYRRDVKLEAGGGFKQHCRVLILRAVIEDKVISKLHDDISVDSEQLPPGIFCHELHPDPPVVPTDTATR